MSTNTPLISVCIPAASSAKHLESALRSVAGQTYTKWEIIVIDGDRDGRNQTAVQEFALGTAQPVSCRQPEANAALPTLLDLGAAHAEGEWVAFLSADALWKPDHLASLVSASQIEDSDLIFSGTVLYDNATWTKLGRHTPKEGDLAGLPAAIYSGRLSILTSAVMIKRSSFKKFGAFAREYPHCCDTEYWLRILSHGGHLCYSGEDTCIYRQNTGSYPGYALAVLQESASICEEYAAWSAIPRSLARTRPARLYRWSGRCLMPDNPADALGSLSHALRLQPLSAKTSGLWLSALFKNLTRRRTGAVATMPRSGQSASRELSPPASVPPFRQDYPASDRCLQEHSSKTGCASD